MNYLDPAGRAALISGLRELVEFLKSNPEVPASSRPVLYAFPPRDEMPAMRAEIDAIAALIGVAGHLTPGGHYVASRSFGPVDYEAVAIPPTSDESE